MIEPEEILAALIAWAQPKLLAGKRVLLTAGPTFEAIDPVRGITNLSSGKMGFALAQACAEAGATGDAGGGTDGAGDARPASPASTCAAPPTWPPRSMRGSSAATYSSPSPRSPTMRRPRRGRTKLKKGEQPLTLTLRPTPDILAPVAGASESAVLRRLRCRNRRRHRQCRSQAAQEKSAAAGRQSRSGHAGPGRERGHTARRFRRPSPAADGQAAAGPAARGRDCRGACRAREAFGLAAGTCAAHPGNDRAQGARRAHSPSPARLRNVRLSRHGPARLHRRARSRCYRGRPSWCRRASPSTSPTPASQL